MPHKTTKNRKATADAPIRKRTLPGLNIQAPWSQNILEGNKTIETRFYPLPKKYIGKEMFIIETPGKKGRFKARIVGTVVFGEPFEYDSEQSFYRDRRKHLVAAQSSDFTWESGKGKTKWGWPILKVEAFNLDLPARLKRGIIFTQHVF
ncbi:MAG: hypothetical protein EBQ92_08970 [Proteobacteria bacterium]|nr:hypothetical protein [Pseudomonadota bacterium]